MSEHAHHRATLPTELDAHGVLRRFAWTLVGIGVIVAIALLTPGLGGVRDHLRDARPGWIAVAVALEIASSVSYVLLFRPVFGRTMPWRDAARIGGTEVGMGSILPASGAGGLALGAWVLNRRGMDPQRIARRSVAFFLIKSGVNFVAVAVLGTAMALGLGAHHTLLLTALPAGLSALVIAAVVVVGRLPRPAAAPDGAGRIARGWSVARRALVDGAAEAIAVVRGGDALVLVGTLGYWAFDNAVLWATYKAFGAHVPLTVVLMGYLIGQLGGALPIPGGIGGIDGGLIGTLVLFGAPAAATTAAVLVYRTILFWVPLVGGAVAFVDLRRSLTREDVAAWPEEAAAS